MNKILNDIADVVIDIIYNSNYNIDKTIITKDYVISCFEKPKDLNNGDIAIPCFKFSKYFKDSPINISKYLESKLNNSKILNTQISKIISIGGYLNFYINASFTSNNILKEIVEQKQNYGFVNEGHGQNVVIDYSSPNIAKPFHLGHLRTTVIGRAIYNLYKQLGYNCIGINYLGDWGRQFGLLIEGYNRFKDDYDIEKDPLHALSDIYVRINKLAKDDEKVMNIARDNFKKLESGNSEYLKLWQYFRDVSLKEYKRIYDILDCHFDSYNGESYYNNKMNEVIDLLNKKHVLVESNGAKVVYIDDKQPPCIIVKSNGSTIYATRDLAAIIDRSRTYDYVKSIYVTSYEQIDYFHQLFSVAKYVVDDKYVKGLVHVPYGMIRLKTGKMSTRDGNVVYLQDMIDESIKKAKDILVQKNSNLNNSDDVAKKVGIGALIFNNLKHNKIKDIVFDLDEILRFDGQTGPYIQYTYVRTQSILKKANFNVSEINIENINYDLLNSNDEQNLIKLLGDFKNIIKQAATEYEPAIIARYLIDIACAFSKMYNDIPVIVDDKNLKVARCILVYSTSIVIKKGLKILGIDCPDKM